MSAFLTELGTRLADQWVKVLLLPGLLWTAMLAVALRLGQRHAFDFGAHQNWLSRTALNPAAHSTGTILLAAAGLSAAAAAASLATGALATVFQRLWASPGDLPPGLWLLAWRRYRWAAATARLKTAIAAADRARHAQLSVEELAAKSFADHQSTANRRKAARKAVGSAERTMTRALRRRDQQGPALPERPTQIADRFVRAAVRISAVNGLSELPVAWPRLWSVLPESARTDIAQARDSYAGAARLAGWGVLYAALSAAWWPAAPLGLAITYTGCLRARSAGFTLADLVETAADLHTNDLAAQMGIAPANEQRDTGRAITARLRHHTDTPSPQHEAG